MKLVQRLARLGELLRALATPAALGPARQGARFELRLPLAEPTSRPPRLAYAASRR